MPEERLYEGGFLLRPSFYKPDLPPQERNHYIQNELGMDPSRFLLVLGTGANAANNHIALLEALHQARLNDIQVLALCSRNRLLAHKIDQWASNHPDMTVRTRAYVQDMKPLLQSASALVCRSGTGLTSEAILCQCPIIFNGMGGVMPQEQITLAYCRRHRLGLPFSQAAELPDVVARLQRNPELLAHARRRKERLRPTRTPQELIRRLQELRSD